jgi:hypothetical protein
MGATFTNEQITPTSATATDNAKTATGGKTAQKMIVSVQTDPVRILAGTNPTATVGLLLAVGIHEFTGYDFIDDARFIDDGATSATVDLQYILL